MLFGEFHMERIVLMNEQILQWRERWATAGAATIPLVAGSKRPVCDAWQIIPSATQWTDVGTGFRGNIGVRCGDGWAVIDADDPVSVGNVKVRLDGLGLKLPEVVTPSGNRHFYLKVQDAPEEFNWCRLPVDLGPGEFRVRNAYVAAPCSEVEGRRYRFLSGDPQVVADLQPISWHHLEFLHRDVVPLTDQTSDLLPIRLVWREMPKKAVQLLNLLGDAAKGQAVLDYPTRSEAEAAVVTMLALSGWKFDEVVETFDAYLPGHYAEKREEVRDKYLSQTWCKVLGTLAGTPERQAMADLYRQAFIQPWPGRELDHATYLALLAMAWQFSSWEVDASQRVLAEHVAATQRDISDALRRLESRKLIECLGRKNFRHAITWRILDDSELLNSHIGIHDIHDVHGTANHILSEYIHTSPELWTESRLGRIALPVLVHVAADGGDVNAYDLAQHTGRDEPTIQRTLARLAGFGLVESSDGGNPVRWRRGPRPLSDVTKELGVEEAARRRRLYHQKERRAWRRENHTTA